MVLPDYPFFPGTLMEEAPRLLDSLATKYVKAEGEEDAAMTRFLFSYVPVTMFDRIYDAPSPGESLPIGGVLWLFHLSGYFGGVWLRDELARTGKNPAISGYSDPQDEAGFVALVDKAESRLDAATGRRSVVLAENEASLFDVPSDVPGEDPERGLVDTFGYNEGYLLQIAEKPPEGLSTPTDFVNCPADPASRPLYCSYGTSRLEALRRFDPVSRRLAKGDGAYGDLGAEIPALQEAAIARGRMVWDGLLNVQGFSQEAYEQLLDISSAFLETVQATVLAAVEAVAEEDVTAGRQASTANACMGVWLGSYITGLTDGREGRALPEFESR